MNNKLRIFFWMSADFIVIISGVYLAFLLRYLGTIPPQNFMPFIKIWYLFGITGILSLYFFRLYNIDGNAGQKEIIRKCLLAFAVSNLIMISICYILRENLMTFPSSIFFIGMLINSILCGFWRIFLLFEPTEPNK